MGWQGKQKQCLQCPALRQVSSPAQIGCQPDKHEMSQKNPHFMAVVPRGLCHRQAARYSGHSDTVLLHVQY